MTDHASADALAHLEARYDGVIAAVLSLDPGASLAAADTLLEALDAFGADADDAAADVGAALLEDWVDADESLAGESEDLVVQVRALLDEVMVRIADAHPHPLFAGAYEQAALARIDDEPAEALRLLDRALALAETPDQWAGHQTWRALALGRLDEPAAAVVAARQARAAASEPDTQAFADAALLQLLCDADDDAATPHALDVLAQRGDDAPDVLGEAVMLALLREAARHERAQTRPPVAVTEGLRRGLDHPGWEPEPLTRADFVVIVAWAEFLRDDLSRLEATVALASGGPFTSVDVEAQAALLDVLVAHTRLDVDEIERRLKLASPVVARSGDPGVVTAFRGIADAVSRARGQTITRSDAELNRLLASRGQADDGTMTLFFDAWEATQQCLQGDARTLPDDVRQRLDAWCAREHGQDDPLMQGVLWGIGAVAAAMDRDFPLGSQRVGRARELLDSIPGDDPQREWLRMLLQGLEPGFLLRSDREAGLAALREAVADSEWRGLELPAFVARTQLAFALLEHDPRASLEAAVRALDFATGHAAALAGSSERLALRQQEDALYTCALRAAAALGDARLMAELLEFLRAQDLPVVVAEPALTQQPLAALLPPAPGQRASRATGTDTDGVQLAGPRPVLMPWGRLALEGLLDAPDVTPARFVVPRPGRPSGG